MTHCAMCETLAADLKPYFGGVCGHCLNQMRIEFEELACDRVSDIDPETGKRRGKQEWVKASFALRDRRRVVEDLVDGWRMIELGPTAAYILSEEREAYHSVRIERANTRRRYGRPYERPPARMKSGRGEIIAPPAQQHNRQKENTRSHYESSKRDRKT